MKTKSTLISFIISAVVMAAFIFIVYSLNDEERASEAAQVVASPTAAPIDLTPSVKNAPIKSVPESPTVRGKAPRPLLNMQGLRENDYRLAEALAAVIQTGDGEALNTLEKEGVLTPEQAKELAGKELAEKDAMLSIGSQNNGDMKRYRLNFKDGSAATVDLTKNAEGKWIVGSINHHSASDLAQAKLHGQGKDALTSVEHFIRAVQSADLKQARQLVVGNKVSDATLAGLCILFEEGEYALRPRDAMKNMFHTETTAGYLVYLVGKDSKQMANIGLELAKSAELWGITAVSMDSLLEAYAKAGSAEVVDFFPLVKNPKGGDSLALFFGFNEDSLTPRSLRQLKIVADILTGDETKRLEITGHTDDVGTEVYNEKLSARRAEAVKKALLAYGVAEDHVVTKAMGMRQPRRSYVGQGNDSDLEKRRSENRRTEIYLDFK